MNIEQEINKILDKAVIEKTFSLEAIDHIKNLRDEWTKTMEINSRYGDSVKRMGQEIIDLRAENSYLKNYQEAVLKREEELLKKERVQEIVILQKEFSDRRANEIKEIFGIVFKNPIVRETVYKNSIVPVSGAYGTMTSMSTSENETKVVEQE